MIEVFREAVHEIAKEPVTFAIEVVQFVVLAFIIKAVGFGLGKRSGIVTNMLAERRERVREQLERAGTAGDELESANADGREAVGAARKASRRTLSEARRRAAEERDGILAAAEEDARAILRQAEEALAKERNEMLSGIREQLVDVVTQGTREILDEGLTPAEQRALIQKAIVHSLDDLENVELTGAAT